MFCTNCKSQIPDDVSFCPKCGASVETDIRCPQCQSVIAAGFDFCPKCGYQFADQTATGSSQAADDSPKAGSSFMSSDSSFMSSGSSMMSSDSTPAAGSTPVTPKSGFRWWSIFLIIFIGLLVRSFVQSRGSSQESKYMDAGASTAAGTSKDTDTSQVGFSWTPASVDLENYIGDGGGTIQYEGTGPINDFTVSILSSRLFQKNSDDMGCIVVKFSYTNNSSEDRYITETRIRSFQDNVVYTYILMPGIPDFISEPPSGLIRPGETVEFERAFALVNQTSDVEIEISDASENAILTPSRSVRQTFTF